MRSGKALGRHNGGRRACILYDSTLVGCLDSGIDPAMKSSACERLKKRRSKGSPGDRMKIGEVQGREAESASEAQGEAKRVFALTDDPADRQIMLSTSPARVQGDSAAIVNDRDDPGPRNGMVRGE